MIDITQHPLAQRFVADGFSLAFSIRIRPGQENARYALDAFDKLTRERHQGNSRLDLVDALEIAATRYGINEGATP